MSTATIIEGDNRETLATLPAGHFHCCVTSPPYYGLRDYGAAGQIGQEPTPADFVDAIREVFRGVRRVLRDDGVAWLNLGDSYADKSLLGIPWRVALALIDDGWKLRQEIIWHKPCPMPESARDRCTRAHEQIFMLTKSPRYFYDATAILEPTKSLDPSDPSYRPNSQAIAEAGRKEFSAKNEASARSYDPAGKNRRSVWSIAPNPLKGAHFAPFPVDLPLRCIQASTSTKGCCPACGAPWERLTERVAISRARPNELTKRTGEAGTGNHCANTVAGVEAKTIGWAPTCACGLEAVEPCRVLDPFNGAGTTGVACRRLGVDYTGCELNPEYIELTRQRLARETNRGSKHKAIAPAPNQTTLFA